jgi:hypothetical protein
MQLLAPRFIKKYLAAPVISHGHTADLVADKLPVRVWRSRVQADKKGRPLIELEQYNYGKGVWELTKASSLNPHDL